MLDYVYLVILLTSCWCVVPLKYFWDIINKGKYLDNTNQRLKICDNHVRNQGQTHGSFYFNRTGTWLITLLSRVWRVGGVRNKAYTILGTLPWSFLLPTSFSHDSQPPTKRRRSTCRCVLLERRIIDNRWTMVCTLNYHGGHESSAVIQCKPLYYCLCFLFFLLFF